MTKNEIIFCGLVGLLTTGCDYKPTQIQAMMGDKYEPYISKLEGEDEDEELHKEILVLFNKYLKLV